MLDKFGRTIEYLRISITDRCNFRCIYCISHQDWKWVPFSEILSFEEIEEIVKVGTKLGVKRVRLTGGEPLIRKDVEILIKKLASLPDLKDLSLTTNGYYLEELGSKLKKAGLNRINISLDTLDREKFKRITGLDGLDKVLRGVEAALSLAFYPVKINVVVIRGFNDEEILDLAKLSLDLPLEVRFIEFMPIGKNYLWDEKHVVLASEIKKILSSYKPLLPDFSVGGGPAKTFRWEGAKGKIGIISPITEHFCNTCNRFRITPDGKLRPCLFSDIEINLKPALREKKISLSDLFVQALKVKPERRQLNPILRPMRAIGG